MVTTSSTGNALNNSTIANNGNMLLYSNHNNNNIAAPATLNAGDGISSGVALSSCNTSTTLEQYRLHLYNYALNMERLRGPPYTAAAAMAAAAAYASTSSVTTSAINGVTVHGSSYAATSSGHMSEPAPGPSNYLCTTPAGNLIAATGHMARTSTVLTQGPSGNRLALASMSLFPQRIFQPEEPKPQHSYIGLIAMAILSSAETKLVLSDIYQYILDNYPYFRTRGPGWRNSIRHNLSLNDCFIKSGRSANGKGHYWAIHPANMEDFRKGDFRRRKAQRKVRKHMGLSVDDNGTDSPSPPPAMDLTSPSPPLFQHITPLASAAQHLAAAQSFGWRFTHQHRQTTQAGTNSSYMGQIFTYRPQHYAAAAAAAAAAALCHSGNQHQNHQQSLINVTNHHQAPQMPNSPQQQSASLLTPPNNPAASTENPNSVINEINSQKRKRQFDVASLLAPDHFSKREQQHFSERTSDEITTSMTCNEDLLQEPVNSNPNDSLDLEDIDVVDASEDEEGLEADYEDDEDERDSQSLSGSNENEEVDYLRSYNNEHLIHNKINVTEDDESIIKIQHFEPPDEDNDEHLKTTISNKKPANSPERISQQENNHFKTNNKTVPNHNQNHSQHQPLSINNDAQHLFGRYYGTYMAAAAAARINSSISKNSD